MRAELTGLLAGAALAGHAGPALTALSGSCRRALGVRDRLGDPGAVALTFDDGPDARGTPAVLEALRREGVPATFFLVGQQVRANPALAREIADAGHDIALHADRHRNLLRLTPRQVATDLDRAADAIASVTGRPCALYRPPYGVLTGAALRHARAHRREVVLWARWGRDWRAAATPASIAQEAAAGLHGGEIILLHDSDRYAAPGAWRATATAIPAIADLVRGAGLRFATHGPAPAANGHSAADRAAGPVWNQA
jgi:peptidoglycan-N-acetylglucosamine deacetylase